MQVKSNFTATVLFFFGLLLTVNHAQAWGKNGHRITGAIAWRHLTPKAAAAVERLLDGDKLAEITTWADEMRSAPGKFWQETSPPWHYINIADWSKFQQNEVALPYEGQASDIYTAMMRCITVLQDRDSPREDKVLHLRLLVHFVGDAHQPLHAGRAEDRGGNDIKVWFFGNAANLHSLWDTGLIESEKLSYSEFSRFIDTENSTLIRKHLDAKLQDWLQESHRLAEKLYQVEPGDYRWQYLYEYMPIVKQRLQTAGIRMAGLLNYIFDAKAKAGLEAIARKNLK